MTPSCCHRPRSTLMAWAVLALLLSGCARPGPPAPVDIRGVGAGETRPGMVDVARNDQRPSSSYSSPYGTASAGPGAVSDAYTPPPGYGARASVQAETLGEPNDAYAQAAATAPRYPASSVPSSPTVSPPGSWSSNPSSPSLPPPSSVPSPSATGGSPAPTVGAPDQGSGTYGWPVRGKIVRDYSKSEDGSANEGLNIAAPLGTPVYAARAGTVAYAGNELRNFGNTVLLRHAGGYFTVYAHLDQISVTKGQTVTRGQSLGTVGQTGGVSEPQVHFEIRKDSTPLDPRPFLGS